MTAAKIARKANPLDRRKYLRTLPSERPERKTLTSLRRGRRTQQLPFGGMVVVVLPVVGPVVTLLPGPGPHLRQDHAGGGLRFTEVARVGR